MIVRALALFAVLGLAAPAAVADARPRDREQDEAYRGTHQGRFVPLRVIESRILPRMRGFSYLGPELDPHAGRYRLKFMRGPNVIWIDVDAATGRIVARFGM